MMLIVQAGATSVRQQIFVADSSVTTGAGKTGLTNASFTAYYFIDGATTPVSITLAGGTVGTWSSGGVKEISSANLPGWYEVGLPNAMFVGSTIRQTSVMYKGTGIVPVCIQYQLVPWNPQDAVRLGLTSIPNVAAGAAGGLPTATNSSGQITGLAGNVTGSVGSVTGAVASVTGSVGSVTGSVGSVTGAVASVIAAVEVGSYASGQDPATLVLDTADAVDNPTNCATPRQWLRVIMAILAGQASGLATATAVFKNIDGATKTRVSATVDANGNRTAIGTLDGT
jgi:hypothetical protein